MTEEKIEQQKNDSLIENAKGIWPLIISVFLVAIYLIVSAITYIISYYTGRL